MRFTLNYVWKFYVNICFRLKQPLLYTTLESDLIFFSPFCKWLIAQPNWHMISNTSHQDRQLYLTHFWVGCTFGVCGEIVLINEIFTFEERSCYEFSNLITNWRTRRLKNVELLKHLKISKTAPTCFGLQGNHHQKSYSQYLSKNYTLGEK